LPADVEQVALGPNGLIEGMRPDTAFFDMSTNSVAMVRKINAAFAAKNLYMLDSPVSGGPGGAVSGKMAIWVGGDEQQFNRHKPVPTSYRLNQIRATRARTRATKAARAAAVERSRSYCARKNERTRRPHIGFSARISTLRPGSPAITRVIHHGEP
jgi:NAD binding domain of 6-phosphogluconate dehydrogenase